MRSWKVLSKIWPALLRSKSSEKESIITLLEDVAYVIESVFETFPLRFEARMPIFRSTSGLRRGSFYSHNMARYAN
jgi:hypothetical protein